MQKRYHRRHIVLHWSTAALLLAMALTGLAYSYDWAGGWTMTAHQILGQGLIVVIAARIVARIVTPPAKAAPAMTDPAGQAASPVWQTRLAAATHLSFYLCLIAYLASGYIAASGLPDPSLVAPVSLTFARSDLGVLILEAPFLLKWVLPGILTPPDVGAAHNLLRRGAAHVSRMPS